MTFAAWFKLGDFRNQHSWPRGKYTRRRNREHRRFWTVHELEPRLLLSTFTVTDTYDDGNPGSLRWAIGQVDADPNPAVDTIDFAIPGPGPFTIYTYSPMLPLTHPALIDGYSQPGASVNTQTTSDNAVLMIDLDGTYTYSPTYGLDVDASGCTVQGLSITDYASGVLLDFQTSGSIIQGNFIGTDVTGSVALGNSEGVLFQGSGNNTVGGTTPAAVNIISGNTGDDISLSNNTGNAMYNDTGNVIEGNYIGLTASGTSTLPTANNGVNISSVDDNIIGGTAAGAGNVIAGQLQDGIQINESDDNVVAGNFIGTDPTGTISLGNIGPGILIENASLGNTIGGSTTGAGNTIAFNYGDGVQVGYYSDDGSDNNVIQYNSIHDNSGAGVDVGSFSSDTTTGDAILSNSIYDNGELGIDLGDDYITQNSPGGPHSGPNDLQNYPVLTTAATFNGSTYVTGTLNSTPDATFTLQFFSNANLDPSGYGQGQTLIGTTTVTTDANGNSSFSASFPGTIPTGESISATATDSSGDTSEFSQDVSAFAASGLIVAANDTYGLFANTVITEPAPGVLANDYDLTGNPLSAVLVHSTSHGTLSFQSDGAFTYTPNANFVGSDTFTYYATDGTNNSNVATVTLNESPLSLTVTNTNDSGPGSLRQALLAANLATSASPGKILFRIPGTGPFTIQLATPLPTITHPTVINGYNEAGATANSLAQGDNAVILIGLVGTGGGDGLAISAGGSTVEGLTFERFQNAIHLTTAGNDVIIGNFIGTGPSGAGNTGANGNGIVVDGVGGNRIGGTAPSDRNLISNNDQTGVWIENGSTGNKVQGNWIGLDVTGEGRLNNFDGVEISDSASNTIGGTAPGAGNVISANRSLGIWIGSSTNSAPGSPDTLIQGNFIGTDAAGEVALGNGSSGIILDQGADCTIGGASAGARNVISNNYDGIEIQSLAPGTEIQGNFIGTDATGTNALGNESSGITVDPGVAGTVIGGPAKGDRNVISGNRLDGISDPYSGSAQATLIQGNYIGTDLSGTLPLGNGADGIDVGDDGDTIGGTAAGAGNLISANTGNGINLVATGVLIQGNLIGTDVSGTLPLGNGYDGVVASGSNNTIGGSTAKAGNVIGFNGDSGVAVVNDATGVGILTNSISGNGGLGIDLGADGVTLNTPGGPHGGPNDLQNFPVLVTAMTFNGKTYVKGTFNSGANSVFTLQFFANAAADPSGYGQGQTYLGQASVATDSSGNASFQVSFSVVVAGAKFVSATATDQGNDTSEFAADIPIAASAQSVYAAADQYHIDLNTSLVVAAPGVQTNDIAANGKTFRSVVVAGPAHGTLTLSADGSFVYTPKTNFTGSDSFIYEDTQGSTTSNVATVTITVNPKTFTVTSTNDSGPGSLRQAILNANQATSATPDTINFKIPGTGPFIIIPQHPLPAVTHATVIDGYSQPGATSNTLQQGDNAVVEIQLSGLNAPGPDGLLITGGGSTVRGLDIYGFINGIHLGGSGQDVVAGNLIGLVPGSSVQSGLSVGVFIDGVPANTIGGTAPASRNVISGNPTFGINAVNAPGQLIEGNEIGTDTTGTLALGNGVGVNLMNSSSSTIGGGSAAAGNLISSSSSVGVQLTDSAGILIESNLIGTDVTGTQPLGNTSAGVEVGPNSEFPSPVNSIEKNVISANGDGILIDGAGDNVIQSNLIGTDITGTQSLGNTRHGLIIADPGSDTVGGTTHGAGNTIAFNQLAGVAVVNNATGVEILSNSIFSNGGLGIDLNDDGVTPNHIGGAIPGPNNLQNFPVLTSAVSSGGKTTIMGTLNGAATSGYLIQLFANVAADPSGYGQGQTLIGSITVTTDVNGNASFTATISTSIPAGQFVSATATDSTGDTSEFAQDVIVTSGVATAVMQTTSLTNGLTLSAVTVPLPGGATSSPGTSQSQSDESVVEALAQDLILDQRRRTDALGKVNQSRYVWV